MANKRIFISDIHLGVGEPWDWFQKPRHEKALCNLLRYVSTPTSEVKDLVLLGDVFDTWLCPMDTKPPSIGDILAEQPKFVAAIQDCLRTIPNVFYVRGNHDMNVSQRDLEPLSVEVDGKTKRVQHIQQYNAGMLYAEHGHRFALFNAADRMHDPADALPLGYFVTRILAGDDTYSKPGAVASYVDDLLEAMFTTQTIAESLVEALAEHRGISLDEPIVMPGKRPPTTLRQVQRRYSGLFDRWTARFGFRYALHAIQSEMGSLGWFADRLCRQSDYRVVVMGHTHDSHFDVDDMRWRGGGKRLYVNSGYWCPNPADRPYFVSVEKQPGQLLTALCSLDDDGFPQEEKSATISTR